MMLLQQALIYPGFPFLSMKFVNLKAIQVLLTRNILNNYYDEQNAFGQLSQYLTLICLVVNFI